MLENHIKKFVKKHNITKCLVGFSGGVDSTVLVYLLAKYTNIDVRAVYVNHSLSDNAEAWGVFCRDFCNNLNVEFFDLTVDANCSSRESTEAVAREKRYDAYDSLLKDGESLILGQHSDDQVETILLQLLRGAGIAGLSGMPIHKEYKNGYISRPFLETTENGESVTKDVIELFAKDNSIKHIFDESNLSNEYKRNFLRNEIIPKLKSEFGNINKSIGRTAINCQMSNLTIEGMTEKLYDSVEMCGSLNIDKLRVCSKEDIAYVLRYWMKKTRNQKSVSRIKVEQIVSFIKNHSNDHKFELKWGEYVLKANGKTLYALNHIKYKKSKNLVVSSDDIKCASEFNFFNICESYKKEFPLGLPLIKLAKFETRQQNKKYFVNEKQLNLKKKMQELNIPEWVRKSIPLYVINDEIIAIGNSIVNNKYSLCSNGIYFELDLE
jgi:tRNA(Ile)-lysidine synthase